MAAAWAGVALAVALVGFVPGCPERVATAAFVVSAAVWFAGALMSLTSGTT